MFLKSNFGVRVTHRKRTLISKTKIAGAIASEGRPFPHVRQ
jgi:hypothetical protein